MHNEPVNSQPDPQREKLEVNRPDPAGAGDSDQAPAVPEKRPALPRQCNTLAEVFVLYLPQAKRDLGARTYESKESILTSFAAEMGHLTIAEARPFDLLTWLDDQSTFRSEWTKRGAITAVKRALNWALDNELIGRNPFARVHSRGRLPAQRQPMSDEHFQALMRASPPAYRRLLVFLKFTGAWPGEASSMRWRNVRFEQRCIVLEEHKTAAVTGKPRLIPLVPTILKLLVWMKARRQASVVGRSIRYFELFPRLIGTVYRGSFEAQGRLGLWIIAAAGRLV